MLSIRSNRAFAAALAISIAASAPSPVAAGVPEDQAARLGAELTPVGGEKAGNASGTVPSWTGGITAAPAGYKSGQTHPDPFADDAVLYEVDAKNLAEHKEHLTAGHQALLERHPTFRMRVYPSRRSASYPAHVYEATRRNAVTAALEENGAGVTGVAIGFPFPLPKTGIEVIWNHLLRYRGESVVRSVTEALVFPNGSLKYVQFRDQYLFSYSRRGARPDALNNLLGYFQQRFTAPARFAGTILLIHETLNQVREPRHSWLYNPGQRRVRRAPFVGFDYPAPTADGLRTIDQFDLFNGAPNRYDWELIGKREMIVPYNAYRLHGTPRTQEALLTPNHLNPDRLRYELHRVWVVEARLKKDHRHLFPRRTFYVDEDSWQVLAVDQYDSAGKLWRFSEGHPINYYEIPAVWTTLEVHYDLPTGRYLAMGLSDEKSPYTFNVPLEPSDFTPSNLRRTGLR